MGGPFFSFVEGMRAIGWLASGVFGFGVHIAYVYAIPAIPIMVVAHIAAFFLSGGIRRFLRWVVLLLSFLILASFLFFAFFNPTLKGGLIAFCAMYMVFRSHALLRADK